MVDLVVETINEVLRESGLEISEMTPETNILHDTSLDSMGLAIVVVKLEEKTGKDPFIEGFKNFHTIKDLANLYAK